MTHWGWYWPSVALSSFGGYTVSDLCGVVRESEDVRLDSQFCIYQNRFLANELPDPDFKYFSKAVAFSLSLNPRNRISSHGRYGFVNFEPPEL